MSSFQGVGIEGFQRCPHFRVNRGVPLYTEVSSFQGIGIERFHRIQRCTHFGVPLYMQRCPHFRVLE